MNGRKWHGRNSLRKVLRGNWIMIMVAILLIFTVYCYYTLSRYQLQYRQESQSMVNHYASELNKDVELMRNYVRQVYSNDVNYKELTRKGNTEITEYRSIYYLSNNLQAKAGSIDYFGGVFYYDGTDGMLRSKYSDYVYSGNRYRLNVALKEYLKSTSRKNNIYQYFEYDGESYLIYTVSNHDKVLGYVLNLNRYFSDASDSEFIVCDARKKALAISGRKYLSQKDLESEHFTDMDGDIPEIGNQFLITKAEIPTTGGCLIMIVRTGMIFDMWKHTEFWFLFILIPMIAFISLIREYRMLNQMMVIPVNHLLDRVKVLKKEKTTPQEGWIADTSEFIEINHKLDEVVEQIENLQRQKYKREIEAKAAMLQYYQMQVNPHFFINCLNIISSMMGENANPAVKTLIVSLSKHFRYVFQSCMRCVTVRQELEEVKEYCNIFMIKGSTPILFRANVEENILDEKIPILSIQTFVENAIKYAGDGHSVLMISATVDYLEENNINFVRIRVRDNGTGYPKDQLEKLNAPIQQFDYSSKHVGIENIRYRINLLYGSIGKLYFYNGLSGEAVAELLLPAGTKEV